MFGEQALHPIEYTEQDWTKERWSIGGPTAIHAPGSLSKYGSAIRAAVRAGALGRHRDLDVLVGLHGRRRALRRACRRTRSWRSCDEEAPRPARRPGRTAARGDPAEPGAGRGAGEVDDHRLRADARAGLPGVRLRAPQRPRLRRQLRQRHPGSRRRSSSGRPPASCCSRGRCPGRCSATTASRSPTRPARASWCCSRPRPSSVLLLDVETGKFTRVARLPDGAAPNYATWVPGGSPAGHRLRATA